MTDEVSQESKNFINLGIILNDKGEVLVVRRAKEEIGKDGKILRWAFPGGKQKFGEDRKQCKLVAPMQIHPPKQPEEIAEVNWVKPEDLKNLFTTSLDPEVAKELKIV